MTSEINLYLEEAQKYNLLAEVILSAINHAKTNPDLPAEVIMDMACDDWDI